MPSAAVDETATADETARDARADETATAGETARDASGHETAIADETARDASADETATADETAREASAAFDAGRAAFRAKDYVAAADFFTAVVERRHDDADAHNYLGLSYLQQNRPDDAADALALALHFRPRFPEALHNLALVAQRRGNLDEAVSCLERAIELKPDFAGAHNDLGYLLVRELDELERGAEHIRRALQLAPGHSDALCNYTMLLIYEGRPEEALVICNRQLAIEPDLHETRLNRALAALKLGRFAEAWPDYEARKLARSNYAVRQFGFPEWGSEPLGRKTILVYAEQGLGDQIMFASCLPDLLQLAGHCAIECSPRLESLFRRSFPAATVFAGQDFSDAARVPDAVDCQVAIGSLPLHFRTAMSRFPLHRGYLHADPERVAFWRQRLETLGPGCKVGISWRGGAPSTRRESRSVPLQDWLPLLSQPHCHFISLQYGDNGSELALLEREHGFKVHHWQQAIDDYEETAALVVALDLTVSVQTAVVHLAGALGRRTWALVPAVSEWRYLQHDTTLPWYPAVRLFRQPRLGDWQPAMLQLAAELGQLAGTS